MNRVFTVSLLCVALASCSEAPAPAADGPAPGAVVVDDAADAVDVTPAPQFDGVKLRTPLPNGIELPFPYHSRFDRIVERSGGVWQRRVNVEILEADAATTMESLIAVMRKSGYRPGEVTTQPDGSVRVAFRHADGRIVAYASNQRPEQPFNDAARGQLLLVMPAQAPSSPL